MLASPAMETTETAAERPVHFVQELGFDVTPGGEVWSGEALVPPGAWTPGTRFPRASVLVTYADVIAGAQARALTLPSLSVTVDLSLDVLAPKATELFVGELTAHSRVLRAGKRMIVTETTFSVPGDGAVAVCTGSFSAISRTLNALGDAVEERRSRHERDLLTLPLAERVGLVVQEPGRAEIARRADLGNSTDSLMGGLTALLGETAAISRLESETGAPQFADRLQIRFLSPVRVGPARAEVVLLGGPPDRQVARVEVRDVAAEGLAADVTVSARPIDEQRL